MLESCELSPSRISSVAFGYTGSATFIKGVIWRLESENWCFQDLPPINKGNPKINADQHRATRRETRYTRQFSENTIEPQCNLSKEVIIEYTRKHNVQKETMEGYPKH